MSRLLSVVSDAPTRPDTLPRRSAAVRPPLRSLAAARPRARPRAGRRATGAAPRLRLPSRPWPGLLRGASRLLLLLRRNRVLLGLDLGHLRVTLGLRFCRFGIALGLHLRGLGIALRLLLRELVLLDLFCGGALRFFLSGLLRSLRVALCLGTRRLQQLALFPGQLLDFGRCLRLHRARSLDWLRRGHRRGDGLRLDDLRSNSPGLNRLRRDSLRLRCGSRRREWHRHRCGVLVPCRRSNCSRGGRLLVLPVDCGECAILCALDVGAVVGDAAPRRPDSPPASVTIHVNAGAGAGCEFFRSDSGGMNVSGKLGSAGVTPGELFGRISGVIITTSSV